MASTVIGELTTNLTVDIGPISRGTACAGMERLDSQQMGRSVWPPIKRSTEASASPATAL